MSFNRKRLTERAVQAVRESAQLDFKRFVDLRQGEAACEILKDVVAFANSGGGIIVFGVEDNGSLSAEPAEPFTLDLANLTNLIAKYTGTSFSDLELVSVERAGKARTALLVGPTNVPLVFVKPGTYAIDSAKQKTAFGQGTIYFRHGAKSEHATNDDLVKWRDRELTRLRHNWLSGIKKVVEAPAGQALVVVAGEETKSADRMGVQARIVADPKAPSVIPTNAQDIWPFRQKEILAKVNARVGRNRVNTHDLTCINYKYHIVRDHPEFAYKPYTIASPQYSEAYVDWLVQQIQEDADFLKAAREDYRAKK